MGRGLEEPEGRAALSTALERISMMPEPETLARMIAGLGMLAAGATVVAFVGWVVGLGTVLELVFGAITGLFIFAFCVLLGSGR